jgi:hypothetical protein
LERSAMNGPVRLACVEETARWNWNELHGLRLRQHRKTESQES